MEAPQTLRRPSNWQDFESLCKKLWGEIWNCPEIQKKRLAKEILIFWSTLIPIFLVLIVIFLNNSLISGKINSRTDLLSECYKSKKILYSMVDISIESFYNKKDSLENGENGLFFYQSYYPELSFFTGHLDEKLIYLIFTFGVPLAHKDSIVELRTFWRDYITKSDIIYLRDKQIFDNELKIQNLNEFEHKIERLTSQVFYGDALKENIIKPKLDEYQDRLISSEKRNIILLNVIIAYFIIIYPLRFIFTSIFWSIKTLKKN